MTRAARPLDWLAFAAARLGWPGLLGLGLLLAALWLDRYQVQPLETAAAESGARAERLTRQPRPSAAPAPAAALADSLPADAGAPEGVARLFVAATHAGLSLEQGSYRPASDQGGLQRYQITLPVSGEYPAIRAFLAEALERQPGLALDSLALSRESIASAEVKARLGLTFYLREAP
jgi:hypothetical protein